ncbi:putative capsular polysaccharide synthesis family protein [Microcystis aeruginosa]|uniref:putative capsular polysaccharide synthesis family protein n=1 Tax=Microcystis aeruginosa TaxID=1126 RepID=UPI00077615C1|nr:putative capsular polysaccharide synthesis family protein [Microcystis aeruginosa]KXS90167.1 AerL protein [Microcystis aeruginosa NIES-88]BCU11557.1 capsular polysaccharide biosynthesis protein [Microcystis aeruginosa]
MNSESKSKMLDKFVPYYPTKDTRNFPIFSYLINNVNIWRLKHKFKQELEQPSVILVYQMGKVGSANLYLAIKRTFPEKAVYHVHNLNPEIVAKIWDKIHLTQPYYLSTIEHSLSTKYLSDHLETIKDKDKIRIIAGVRDPIARNISWFLQIIDCESAFPQFFRKFKEGLITIDDMVNCFWSQKFVFSKQFDWFELELKSVFGIDISEIDFPKEKGYTIVEFPDKKIELLLFKLEKLDSCLQEMTQAFFGIEKLDYQKLKLIDVDLEYHRIYENFKNSLTFSDEYLEEIYDQPLVSHFYTDEEINKFKLKWSSQR